jgi:hypothetical protein
MFKPSNTTPFGAGKHIDTSCFQLDSYCVLCTGQQWHTSFSQSDICPVCTADDPNLKLGYGFGGPELALVLLGNSGVSGFANTGFQDLKLLSTSYSTFRLGSRLMGYPMKPLIWRQPANAVLFPWLAAQF